VSVSWRLGQHLVSSLGKNNKDTTMAQTASLAGMLHLHPVTAVLFPVPLSLVISETLRLPLLNTRFIDKMADIVLVDRGPSSLASKNPFRNLVSDNSTARPISTNPFLDSNEISSPADASSKVPHKTIINGTTSPSSPASNTADIFVIPPYSRIKCLD
jgi:hypothetical protein